MIVKLAWHGPQIVAAPAVRPASAHRARLLYISPRSGPLSFCPYHASFLRLSWPSADCSRRVTLMMLRARGLSETTSAVRLATLNHDLPLDRAAATTPALPPLAGAQVGQKRQRLVRPSMMPAPCRSLALIAQPLQAGVPPTGLTCRLASPHPLASRRAVRVHPLHACQPRPPPSQRKQKSSYVPPPRAPLAGQPHLPDPSADELSPPLSLLPSRALTRAAQPAAGPCTRPGAG